MQRYKVTGMTTAHSIGQQKNFLWQKPMGKIPEDKVNILSARLHEIARQDGVKKIANSLSAEDMVILHHWHQELQLRTGDFFMLETGRLHQATLDYLAAVEGDYGIEIFRVLPDADDVASMVKQYGLNGFYDSVAARKACCGVRKVAPLKKILSGAALWVTGQRQGQGVTRSDIAFEENDDTFGLKKYNPIFDWSEAEVFGYLAQHGVRLHPLYDKGYASIGCEPCSRAIKATEDVRAGRWWWESADNKECGINEINIKK